MDFDVIIVGGGAAGFFTAIQLATLQSQRKIVILERGKEVLTKVKISGGGRCNVTHAIFDPNEFVNAYPRGKRELKGPFHSFCSGDVFAFFESCGVELKIEQDGRVFPKSDTSQSIIDCFLEQINTLGVKLNTSCAVKSIHRTDLKESPWTLETTQGKYRAAHVVITTGSNPKMWDQLESMGHKIVKAVPSLFTFNIKDSRIQDLMGLATDAQVSLLNQAGQPIELEASDETTSSGPLLITHWGMSGPAILKLSAWGARALHQLNYQFKILVNWLPQYNFEDMAMHLTELKQEHAKKHIVNTRPFELPKRLWLKLLEAVSVSKEMKWADMSKVQLRNLARQLTQAQFTVNGKSTFKEEFVTAGGVDLKEINFKTYQSKVCESLYLAGEVLDIDAITGGFNFQNAWTGGFIIANAISEKLNN
ncbi:hypothetical protein I215_13632 [Galbibacter marinus]|uniref:Flavoprotein n=1 Tax=Galbibacter marinus TaxID=555500 RepID=K2NZJ9_9FLAO|nr:NAD(P)/FAD-dependent oxidoreductase [Galbibacter marinus]EKF54218.1 hypothetical protein I215_13632 [Galbibacter marinus]